MLDFCATVLLLTLRATLHRSEPLIKDRNDYYEYLAVFNLRVFRLKEWRFDVSKAAVWICVDYDEDHVCQRAPALFPLNLNHVLYIYI